MAKFIGGVEALSVKSHQLPRFPTVVGMLLAPLIFCATLSMGCEKNVGDILGMIVRLIGSFGAKKDIISSFGKKSLLICVLRVSMTRGFWSDVRS